MPDKTQHFWDKQAKNYDSSERQFEPAFKNILSRTKTYLSAEDTVLDFGCATGTKTIQLADTVKYIHGLDISAGMINEANKKNHELALQNIRFTQGDIFDNNFKQNSFDVILSYGVIHLLKDVDTITRRLYDLLKPGGLFIVSTACLKDKMAIKNKLVFNIYLLIKKLGIFPLHLNRYTPADIEKIITDQDFRIIEADVLFHGITISFIVAQKD